MFVKFLLFTCLSCPCEHGEVFFFFWGGGGEGGTVLVALQPLSSPWVLSGWRGAGGGGGGGAAGTHVPWVSCPIVLLLISGL